MIKFCGVAPKYSTNAELVKVIEQYFNDCEEQEVYPTVSGLAYALNLSRGILVRYKNMLDNPDVLKQIEYSEKVQMVDSIKRAYEYIENGYEEKLINGKTTPIGTIFALKNNFHWVDKQEVEQTSRTITIDIEED